MSKKYTLGLDRPAPGILERLGAKAFRSFASRRMLHRPTPSDDVLVKELRVITWIGAFLAFAAGSLTTVPAVYLQVIHDGDPFAERMFWMFVPTIVMTGVEFALLFYTTVWCVVRVAEETGHGPDELDRPLFLGSDSLPNLLSRAALEIPDPVYQFLGIDPTKLVPQKTLLIIGIIYKIKVMATNALVKLVLMRFLGNTVMRMSVAYIAVVITGIWNSIVLWRVLRETRLRLSGHMLVRFLTTEIITPERIHSMPPLAREATVRAVANAVVLTQNYHPNMLLLLVRLCEITGIDSPGDYDEWDRFVEILGQLEPEDREFQLDLLSIAAAFDGKLSKFERNYLPQAFGPQTDWYMNRIRVLSRLMVQGRIRAAISHCFEDFNTDVTFTR